uniref:Uncharacterized protein n=1 Tax=Anopheles farauti TaxID=69004 RepID=A0A182R0R2_9DIPT
MQRHRRKDRSERAVPTIQKYLHSAAGGLSVSNNTPVATTNENFYQPCVGGPSSKTGPPVCCRKDEILFQASSMSNPGCYPDSDPDGIEVYKEQQHQPANEEQYRGEELNIQIFKLNIFNNQYNLFGHFETSGSLQLFRFL